MPFQDIQSVGTGESVVLAGISGRFPQTNNVREFAQSLYDKRDLVDDLETRWEHIMPGVPRRTGKVNNLDKFDRDFFNIDRRHRDTMDPQLRMLIEHAYEAILDAGIHPDSMRGSKTGVFCGVCFSETEVQMYYKVRPQGGLGVLGCSKSQFACRVSYELDLTGPTFVIDTACSSSMYALDVAYRSIANGECDSALVMGSNLTLHPYITYQFALLGVLAKDGYCRPFDKDATGYTRSEAVCAVFLQKAKEAKRVYGTIVHSKTNCDGFKSEGITYPSGAIQQQLLQEFYNAVGISPANVDYVEAHSTGTFVGDPEECDALDKVYCAGRKLPLPVGSIKSSIGHSEASAGVCSIAKCIIAMENGLIPPNINFVENRPSIPSLVEGRLKVVAEVTPLAGPLVAINSFGFGGANAHALLCRNLKEKMNHGLPEDDLPRLAIWSGRTRAAVETMMLDISQRPLDAEFLALLYNIQKQGTPGHRYRGYSIFRKNGDKSAILQESCINRIKLDHLPLVVIFGGINYQWRQELDALRQFTQVEATIEKSSVILQTFRFDMFGKAFAKNTILCNVVGTTVLQLAYVDLLSSIGVKFDFYGGHSVGQLTCGYIDHCLSFEQVIRLAFWHGLVYSESKANFFFNAFVKLNPGLKRIRLNDLVANEASSFGIITGTEQMVAEQIFQLGSSGFSVEELSFMSLRCEPSKERLLTDKLRQTVNTVLSKPLDPTSKWITVKLPKTSLYSPKLHGTASIVNLLEKIPKHTYVMEIGSSRSCRNVLQMLNLRSHFIPSGHESADFACRLLTRIGHIYMTTQDLHIAKLYQPIQFPVSRGTTMISPLIRWDHRESAYVVRYSWLDSSQSNVLNFKINLSDQNYSYIVGHCIDGRVLFPATGYLLLVWDLLAYLGRRETLDYPIEFEDIRFVRATTIAKGQSVTLSVQIQDFNGFFEILEGDSVVVTGYARGLQSPPMEALSDTPSKATIMPTRDFYKELRLRGYHYTGLFKSVLQARSDGTMAKIQWNGSWVPFLDCLLQVGIIAADTRSLMVPTAIEKITISPRVHLEQMMEKDEEEHEFFTMRSCPKTNVSVCGGVTISNPRANTIGRRNPPGVPVLETYQFVPYCSDQQVSALEACRMCVQIALENVPTFTINVVEVQNDNLPVVVHLFGEAVADLPLVQSNLTLLTANATELENVTAKNEKLANQNNLMFLITDNRLADPNFIRDANESLCDTGFILLRESTEFTRDNFSLPDHYKILATFSVDREERFILLQRKTKTFAEQPTVVRVDSNEFSWLAELKQAVKIKPVVLYSQNDSISGIIGLVNCIRKEPKLLTVRCVFIDDPKAPPFALNEPLYRDQLNLGLAFNVYKNGVWGSYRHSLLSFLARTEPVNHHCYANCLTKGDMSSMMWFTGAMNEISTVPNRVNVMYSALNFRDVMSATGRLSSDLLTSSRMEEECELGYEFSGVTDDGRRVMGAMGSGALATMVEYDPLLTWSVPEEWSLEEASTVPVVYGTVYMAFFWCTKIKKGKSILIHAGSGGIGLAAIEVALAYGLVVYTTVSTKEKRKFLMKRFPALIEGNIGNSRDTSFEQMVKVNTNGKGVDYVLNSLAEEKLQASIRCLGKGGHFLEIGKYDMARNSNIAMELFQKGLTFTSVMLDLMFNEVPAKKKVFHDMLKEAFNTGIIKPLNTNVFDAVDLEKALRFLASGKHTGKILIKIRQHETDKITLPISYVPRVYCNPEFVYIIAGGLGGFGLELADWLVIRGCRKLVLSSSRGVTKPYQEYRLRIWNSYGVQTLVSTADITSLEGCRKLCNESCKLGSVAAIYNLAVQLHDAIVDNQTPDMFVESLAPKAKATEYLDMASRELCPQLTQFVVFSSVSCGRGNAGQSNYGMANSIMERIIERRKADGLPAKAIQWGAIGEVGLVADMAEDKIDVAIGGTLQQRINSCIHVMDRLLTCDDPVVASMVVAEKRLGGGSKNIIEAVMNIMCIRELKSISMESTLADIGMDSLMAVEIKQVLERDFDLVLSPQDLRTLSFAKLLKLEEEKKQAAQDQHGKENSGPVFGVHMMLRNLGNEENSEITVLRIPSASDQGRPILIIPGMEGVAGNVWTTIAEKVNAPVHMLQLLSTVDCESIQAIVDCLIDELCSKLFNEHDNYAIVAYSFGAFIAIELTKRLQAKGMRGKLLLLDGAPKFLKALSHQQLGENPTDAEIQKMIIFVIMSLALPNQSVEKTFPILEASSFESQIEKMVELGKEQSMYSPSYTRKMTWAVFKRLKMATYVSLDEDQPLDLPIALVRPTEVSIADIEEDYGLSKLTTGAISLRTVEGSHMSMLENVALVEIINSFNL